MNVSGTARRDILRSAHPEHHISPHEMGRANHSGYREKRENGEAETNEGRCEAKRSEIKQKKKRKKQRAY